ncbi:Uncharacterised protein [uncultured archaeon]|nr:Uncharacterised protein [uncultured archaeon]
MAKNKRGFLLGEETVKIVIAVICIGFLVYLLVSIYFSVSDQPKIKEANAIMTSDHGIAKEITRINGGGTPTEQGFLVPNPTGWYLFGFTEDKKPNLCSGTNCICICSNVLLDVFNAQINECDNKGSCVVVSNLKSFDKIKIGTGGVFISIRNLNNQIVVAKNGP